jgi:maltooligosyltrehalose trehalohydrolase
MPNLARTLNQGWHFTGQYSEYLQEHRGTDPAGIPPQRFVFCIQNHDQIGNRALGERLHHEIELPAYRAASVVLLCAPATPLLFMGQEWAATTPFLYFTDHPETLGKLVTEGRRQEFRHFSAFSDADARAGIPDPQAETTFLASRLDWSETAREPHASTLRLYQRLLSVRRQEQAVRGGAFEAFALTDETLLLRQDTSTGPSLLAVVQMNGAANVRLGDHALLDSLDLSLFQLLFTTEDRAYAVDPHPPVVEFLDGQLSIVFRRPSAVLLSVWPRAAR